MQYSDSSNHKSFETNDKISKIPVKHDLYHYDEVSYNKKKLLKILSLSMENIESGSISWKWDEIMIVRIYKKTCHHRHLISYIIYQRIEHNKTQEKRK